MTKDILKDLIDQNRTTCDFTYAAVSQENSAFKLNEDTASIGFIFRHLGEIMHLLLQFLGVPTEVQNTTMGQTDNGEVYDREESQKLVDQGYQKLYGLLDTFSEEEWAAKIDTPFFGQISRAKLLGHILYHNTYHCGQITLTLKRGKQM